MTQNWDIGKITHAIRSSPASANLFPNLILSLIGPNPVVLFYLLLPNRVLRDILAGLRKAPLSAETEAERNGSSQAVICSRIVEHCGAIAITTTLYSPTPSFIAAVKSMICSAAQSIEQFLHLGLELEERLLACMCMHNYTSAREKLELPVLWIPKACFLDNNHVGTQNLMSLSEGLRESLRRLSSITWMAEDLLKLANSVLPKKTKSYCTFFLLFLCEQHVSCVHTQILEAGNPSYGAINALLYYKGMLCTYHPYGSIRVWDIKGQTTKYAWEVKAHKKQITCVALFKPRDNLLTGSSDKTIKVWQMKKRKLECVQVIELKDSIQKIDSCGQMIFIITQSCGVKVYDGSRDLKTTCKNKRFASVAVTQVKIHLGCTNASIQVPPVLTLSIYEGYREKLGVCRLVIVCPPLGLHIVEQSQWKVVPHYLHRVNTALKKRKESREQRTKNKEQIEREREKEGRIANKQYASSRHLQWWDFPGFSRVDYRGIIYSIKQMKDVHLYLKKSTIFLRQLSKILQHDGPN
ncbi:hypothetical protein H6P81_006308 [Aristolochia fimbriata]|uniref:Uncharacterized protein n=1 Tax=Aristolochia fimbriata TaxID=158543 RepID=A0AAV7EXW9_ARIFI|nr:hypothetical protein H6P81_006308 [Aristolochia fimbriata]